MKKIITFILTSFLLFSVVNGQSVAINNDGSSANASAALDIKSTDKGMLVPRMTTAQRALISSPATGLLVFDTTTGSFWFYTGSAWKELSGDATTWTTSGNNIYNNNTGSVGLGVSSPNSSSILDMGSSAKPMILPRLTSDEMNNVVTNSQGMLIYNTTEHQLYSYMRYRTSLIPLQSNNRWQPVTTGPRMLAWGVVDSFATTLSGGGTHSITWDATNNWYRLSLANPHEYYKDSMLLIITPVGNGSWDQVVSTGELIETFPTTTRVATIKFTDVTRKVAMFSDLNSRRRSGFHFVLYDLRKNPY